MIVTSIMRRRLLSSSSSLAARCVGIMPAPASSATTSRATTRHHPKNHDKYMSMTTGTRQTSAADENNNNNHKQAKTKSPTRYSLALTTYFQHDEILGPGRQEVLIRATAYLLGVDPPDEYDITRKIDKYYDEKTRSGGGGGGAGDDESDKQQQQGRYDHIALASEQREERDRRSRRMGKIASTPASVGKPGRRLMDLGWLEFLPREVRPRVHIVCSGHVVAPWRWPNYYKQDWLQQLDQQHVSYALEIYDDEEIDHHTMHQQHREPLLKIAIPKYVEPYHHPEKRDISLLHFAENEKSLLDTIQGLGVQVLSLRDSSEKLFQKDEPMTFDGYVVIDNEEELDDAAAAAQRKNDNNNEDYREFVPYRTTGVLSMHDHTRFFATTANNVPLPHGLCGGPVLDRDNELCGTVEGIVPPDHPDERLAGCAAFMPAYVMQPFIDNIEQGMVRQMVPKSLYQRFVTAKKTNTIGGGVFRKKTPQEQQQTTIDVPGSDSGGSYSSDYVESNWDDIHGALMARLKQQHSPDEVSSIMNTIDREREEVIRIWDKEGGDFDEIVTRVRSETIEKMQTEFHDEYYDEMQQQGEGTTKSLHDDGDDRTTEEATYVEKPTQQLRRRRQSEEDKKKIA